MALRLFAYLLVLQAGRVDFWDLLRRSRAGLTGEEEGLCQVLSELAGMVHFWQVSPARGGVQKRT